MTEDQKIRLLAQFRTLEQTAKLASQDALAFGVPNRLQQKFMKMRVAIRDAKDRVIETPHEE